jgi:hypothetical protein
VPDDEETTADVPSLSSSYRERPETLREVVANRITVTTPLLVTALGPFVLLGRKR